MPIENQWAVLLLCFVYIPRSFTQYSTSSCDAPDENLLPSFHLPVPVCSFKVSPLFPISEDVEVQKGITVLSVKSLPLTKLSTGQAAPPHQIE